MSRAAVVIGASGGIGRAFVEALAEEGAYDVVHRFARSETGGQHMDLEDEASIAAAAAIVADGPPVELLLIATGLLHERGRGPEKAFRDLDAAWLARSYAVNAIGPALVFKHFLPLIPRTGKPVFAALSARVGSISDNRLGGWHGYRAAKAALNMLIRNFAIEQARRAPGNICVGLHPGTVDTGLSKAFQGGVPGDKLFTPQQSAGYLLGVIDGLKAQDSGKCFDWAGQEVPA